MLVRKLGRISGSRRAMADFVPISDEDWSEIDVDVCWFHADMTKDETMAWISWFHRHGVRLSESDGGRVLIWRSDQRGYAVRYVSQRRIGWFNPRSGHEFLQLESPPLPFPAGAQPQTLGWTDD